MIAQSSNRTSNISETVHDAILEKAMEDTGVLVQGEINAADVLSEYPKYKWPSYDFYHS